MTVEHLPLICLFCNLNHYPFLQCQAFQKLMKVQNIFFFPKDNYNKTRAYKTNILSAVECCLYTQMYEKGTFFFSRFLTCKRFQPGYKLLVL